MSSHDPRGIGMFPQLLGVSQFLEKHPAVTDVQFYHRAGATKVALSKWESRNHPHQLPEDLRSFLGISDGLLLRWGIKLGHEAIPALGNMHINSLPAMVRAKEESVLGGSGESQGRTAYVLDASPSTHGRVLLVYKDGENSTPSVWFESLDCQWYFVARTFTDYFRLLIMHLGLPAWCHSFTDTGLPPVTAEWFAFLSPERYRIDLHKGLPRKEAKRPPPISLSRIAGHLEPQRKDQAAAAAAAPAPGGSGANAADSKPDRLDSGRKERKLKRPD
eukprot:Hpha_TRINITY_DN15488_c0_g2::TRINITY_DN15488_c0_g2_i1::g.175575::m.175575/K16605/TPGS2; tubulin polyglutamylase complex subunit 2